MDTDVIIGLTVFLGLVLIAAVATAVFRQAYRGGPRHRQSHTNIARIPRQRGQPESQDREHQQPTTGLRALTDRERAYYENGWAYAQERFTTDPTAAVDTADRADHPSDG